MRACSRATSGSGSPLPLGPLGEGLGVRASGVRAVAPTDTTKRRVEKQVASSTLPRSACAREPSATADANLQSGLDLDDAIDP